MIYKYSIQGESQIEGIRQTQSICHIPSRKRSKKSEIKSVGAFGIRSTYGIDEIKTAHFQNGVYSTFSQGNR